MTKAGANALITSYASVNKRYTFTNNMIKNAFFIDFNIIKI